MFDYERPLVNGFTIDPLSCKDRDDALWISKLKDCIEVYVSIADVASLIPKGSTLDIQALKKSFSRYYETTFNPEIDPMFPLEISEQRASLVRKHDRRTVTVMFRFDDNGEQQGSPVIEKTLLRAYANFSYERVEYLINANLGSFSYQLNALYDIAFQLRQKRRNLGALIIPSLNDQWLMDEEGVLKKVSANTHKSHLIVEEFMIATNVAIANFLLEQRVPALYRNHTVKLDDFDRDAFVQEMETDALAGSKEQVEVIRNRVNAVFNRATYGPELIGHYGLSLPAYTHFTSPIRRYPDLVNQRIVSALLEGKPTPYTVRELEQIAGHVNKIQGEIADKKRHFYTTTVKNLSRQMKEGDYSGLDTRLLCKIVESALLTGKFSNALLAEIAERYRAGTLGVRSTAAILCDKQWAVLKDVRDMIKASLFTNAIFAKSLFYFLTDRGTYPVPQFETHTSGGGKKVLYMVGASICIDGKEYRTNGQHFSHDHQTAVGKACADLLIQINHKQGDKVREPGLPVAPVVQVEQEKQSSPQNYKTLLNNLALQQKWKMPHYKRGFMEFENGTLFGTRCTLMVAEKMFRSAVYTTENDKIAGQQAARDILEQLQNAGYDVSLEQVKEYSHLMTELMVEKPIQVLSQEM